MLLPDLDEKLRYFDKSVVNIGRPASLESIKRAEDELSVVLPRSMKDFVLEHNGLSVGGDVSLFPLDTPPHRRKYSLVSETIYLRDRIRSLRNFFEDKNLPIPKRLPGENVLMLGKLGTGDLLVMLTGNAEVDSEYPIALLDHETAETMALAASNYQRLVWFILDDLRRQMEPSGEYKEEEAVEESDWPFDTNWMLTEDPDLKKWL